MNVSTPERRPRVRALSPDDRREALITATVPLVRVHGLAVSTRQIAEAAGVAEGTIFGVFPDKSSLIRAAVIKAFDPAPAVEAIAKIDVLPKHPREQDLRRRLVAATYILWYHIADNAPLVAAVRCGTFAGHGGGPPPEVLAARQRIVDALTAVIEPDGTLLRRSPAITAGLLLSMVYATGTGGFGQTEAFDAPEVVSLVLDGLLKRGHNPC